MSTPNDAACTDCRERDLLIEELRGKLLSVSLAVQGLMHVLDDLPHAQGQGGCPGAGPDTTRPPALGGKLRTFVESTLALLGDGAREIDLSDAMHLMADCVDEPESVGCTCGDCGLPHQVVQATCNLCGGVMLLPRETKEA